MPDYTRYLDVFLTHSSGWYDFAGEVLEQANHQTAAHGLAQQVLIAGVPAAGTPGGAVLTPQLPTPALNVSGYVGVVVPVAHIAGAVVNPAYQQYVQWVGDTGQIGKIRINSHGDGQGHFLMYDQAHAASDAANAAQLVAWLAANGLPQPTIGLVDTVFGNKASNGLVTLAFAFCMAARGPGEGASQSLLSGALSPGPNSAVADAVTALRAQGWRGVEVTGSNEITASTGGRQNQAVRAPSMTSLGFPAGMDFQTDAGPDGTGTQITVPHGFLVEYSYWSGTGRIRIPPTCTVTPDPANVTNNPSGGWDIQAPAYHIPAGWLVTRDPGGAGGSMATPAGWQVTPSLNAQGGGILFNPDVNAGEWQPLTHSDVKVRAIS
ncbi:hypothetical protein [Rhodospirillum centenum]|uniref:Uncharacterized protein n=1 Tax=Rhodospirillum centenum (strain ATCC 51521 / SW) TaxID=414684 RepID=B6IUC0_RHOCS|nr:hypothetical protein [Rhodospirillum centenum]ACJ00100.1 hypothetical protein RC1_2725 [Rhodospirillum centenum SW]